MKKKIGIIGCGSRIRHVADNVLKSSESIEVTAVFDTDEKSIQKAKKHFGEDIKICESDQQLCEINELDWVFIGSWNCAHADQAICAIENGKHVFCEKPLATNLEDCLRIAKALRKTDLSFVVGFTLRYSPFYHKIRELIQQGKLGYLISMEFNETLDFNHGGYIHRDWRRLKKNAGSHLLEKCCHDLDLVNWIVDSRPARVAGFGGTNFFIPENVKHMKRIGKNSDGKDAYTTWECFHAPEPFTGEKDILDNQVAIIEYENNVRATFHTNANCAIPERRMYILGSEGCIRADVLTGSIEIKRIGFDTEIEKIETNAKGGHGNGDGILGQQVADCILGNAPSVTPLHWGLLSAATAFAIDEATDKGVIVHLDEIWNKVDQHI